MIIKSIRKGIEKLTKRLFSFYIIVFNMKFLVILIRKSICYGKLFGSLHTSNRIYLLRNCFSNYVYLNDMYMSLKGIGKILFVSVLRILLICKTLNFTAFFTKKSFQSLHSIFCVRKLTSVKHFELILPFIAFENFY